MRVPNGFAPQREVAPWRAPQQSPLVALPPTCGVERAGGGVDDARVVGQVARAWIMFPLCSRRATRRPGRCGRARTAHVSRMVSVQLIASWACATTRGRASSSLSRRKSCEVDFSSSLFLSW